MCTVFAWWDISWWVAVLFAIGAIVSVACGFFFWLPKTRSHPITERQELVWGGWTDFVSSVLWTIGGLLMVVEAFNANEEACFGWALEQAVYPASAYTSEEQAVTAQSAGDDSNRMSYKPAPDSCNHHHRVGLCRARQDLPQPSAARKWEWWPSWDELRTRYFHELGFWGNFLMGLGCVIAQISATLALPAIYVHLSHGVVLGVFWGTFLIGSAIFIVASWLLVLETQQK